MNTKLLLPAVFFLVASLVAVVATSAGTSAQTPEATATATVTPTATTTTTPVASPTTAAASLCAGTGIQVVAGGNVVTLGSIGVTLPGSNNFAIGSRTAGGVLSLTVCDLATQATVTINSATGAVGARSGTSAAIEAVIASVAVGGAQPNATPTTTPGTIAPPSTGSGGLR